MALWDLAGKAYNVPVYQMLGGKFRDKIRIYCDTTHRAIPRCSASVSRSAKTQGFTWLKMDLGINLVNRDARHGHAAGGNSASVRRPADGAYVHWPPRSPKKASAMMADYVAAVREPVGLDIPLSADHFGHIERQ